MILYPVQSSMLAAVGYDSKTETLVVLFNTGKAYTYIQVPFKVYLGLVSAESKGKYMNEHIIGVYPAAVFSGWNSRPSRQVMRPRTRPPVKRVVRR